MGVVWKQVKRKCFFLPENKGEFDFSQYSYVVDAVDTVIAKIQLVLEAKNSGVPIISSMGAGNKLDPTRFEIADIYETSVCPLAKVMRKELKKRSVDHLKVVYSKEKPVRPIEDMSISCRTNCICPPGTKHKCTERRDNSNVKRYRLTEEEILSCCRNGYELGFRTFVLQGGENPYYTDERMEK